MDQSIADAGTYSSSVVTVYLSIILSLNIIEIPIYLYLFALRKTGGVNAKAAQFWCKVCKSHQPEHLVIFSVVLQAICIGLGVTDKDAILQAIFSKNSMAGRIQIGSPLPSYMLWCSLSTIRVFLPQSYVTT